MKHYENQHIEEGVLGNIGKAALIATAATAHDYTPKNTETPVLSAARQTPEYIQAEKDHRIQQQKEAEELARQRAHHAMQQNKIKRLASITTQEFGHVSPEEAHHYASLAVKYAHPDFPKAEDLMASMAQESTMRSTALSGKGAYGLMQVVPKSWEITYADIDTPEKQVMHGSRAMHTYYKKYKNPSITLQAYNMGPANIAKGNMNEPYAEKHAAFKKKYMKGIEND